MQRTILTKLTVGLLALLMVLSCLVACGKKDPPASDTGSGSNPPVTSPDSDKTVSDDLPDTQMNGFELSILSYTDAAHGYSLKTMTVDENDEKDMIEQAIFERNMAIETRFDCYISEIQQDRPYDIMRNDAKVGSSEYDVALMYEEHINRVLVADPTGLAFFEDVPSLNLSKPYWSQDANDVYSIGGHQYAGVGDWCLSMYSKMYCYFLNKNVYNTVAQEKNIYDLVRDKEWTIAKMFEIGGQYALELDGEDGWTAGDRYGIVGTSKIHFQLLLTGCGLKYVEKDENGNYALALTGTRASGIIDEILRFNDSNVYYNNQPDLPNGSVDGTEFEENRALLLTATIQNLESILNKTEAGAVGVLPAPLFDSNQDNYRSIAIGGLLTCFPSVLSASRKEYTGMIVEALCCASYNTVVPKYREELLKSQRSDSPDDAEMMELLFETTTFDLGCSTWANSIRLPILANVFHPTSVPGGNKRPNYTSMITILAGTVETDIQKTVDAVNQIIAAREQNASGEADSGQVSAG